MLSEAGGEASIALDVPNKKRKIDKTGSSEHMNQLWDLFHFSVAETIRASLIAALEDDAVAPVLAAPQEAETEKRQTELCLLMNVATGKVFSVHNFHEPTMTLRLSGSPKNHKPRACRTMTTRERCHGLQLGQASMGHSLTSLMSLWILHGSKPLSLVS